MDRRGFLKLGAQVAAAGAAAGAIGSAAAAAAENAFASEVHRATKFTSILDGAPSDSGIDHVVIVMMENRSFDSYLGWLSKDQLYWDTGRSRYGKSFAVNGNLHQVFTAPDGTRVKTEPHGVMAGPINIWEGCGHNDPGHGWDQGRAERDGGFLASGSGNDNLALEYFRATDLPIYQALARHYTICDDWHASLLGPTYPNREYHVSGQSGGHKDNYLPIAEGGFQWPAIFDRLSAAGVSVTDYASDFPTFVLWGNRAEPLIRTYDDFKTDAAAGTLPSVSYVEPHFIGDLENDDHPLADPRGGQQFIRDVVRTLVRSRLWQKSLLIINYDEWGGFFDHVAPPVVADDRSSPIDEDDFGQCGFRVPNFLVSPYALPNYVDHTQYDHTSVLRFLEWRFLGAPANGTSGNPSNPWWLTTRDRNAKNLGRSLSKEAFDPAIHFDINMALQDPSPPCAENATLVDATHPFAEAVAAGYLERIGLSKRLSHVG
jgi:phospholipase C